MNRKQFVKILPSKYLLFNRYSLQSVTIRENFPLEKLGIAQFVKVFPLKNNPLYGITSQTLCEVAPTTPPTSIYTIQVLKIL